MAISLRIVPVLLDNYEVVEKLEQDIPTTFPVELEATVVAEKLDPPAYSWDTIRRQYKAWIINREITKRYYSWLSPPRRIILGICSCDAYVPGLNFVFGLASPVHGVATIYLYRLYASNKQLLYGRVLKEAVHEIGHLLGLDHCTRRKCVMSFSNSVYEVDLKTHRFCRKCSDKLVKNYS